MDTTTRHWYCYHCDLFLTSNVEHTTCPKCNDGFIRELTPREYNETRRFHSSRFEWTIIENPSRMAPNRQFQHQDEINNPQNRMSSTSLPTLPPIPQLSPILQSLLQQPLATPIPNMFSSRNELDTTLREHTRTLSETLETWYPFSLQFIPFNTLANLVDMDELLDRTFTAQEPTERPTSQETMNTLPSRTYHKERQEHDLAETCGICLEEYIEQDTLINLPCGHEYHEQCILPWLRCHNTCPSCRQPVEQEQE